jgi:GT2 family glycosyltransferase
MIAGISFIILSWNSRQYLERCFSSILSKCNKEEIDHEIIVIDNGSKDGSVAILSAYAEEYPDVFKNILLAENTGTTYSRNLGLRAAAGEYICVLDSDAELGRGKLSDLLDLLKERSDVGIVAPKILTNGGEIQNSVKRFPTFWHKLLKIPKIVTGLETRDFDFYTEFPFDAIRTVDSAISACWFFKRNLIEVIGLLDERIFYSPEDLDFCMRVYKARKKIIYYPFFEVLHHTQQISYRRPFSRMSIKHLEGLIYYFGKHGGWLSVRAIDKCCNSSFTVREVFRS